MVCTLFSRQYNNRLFDIKLNNIISYCVDNGQGMMEEFNKADPSQYTDGVCLLCCYVPGWCEDDQGVPGGGVEQHHEAQQPQRVEEGPLQPPGRPGH